MSTTLEAFVVDPDRLQRTFGSNDAQLVLGIAQHFEREIQNLESEAAGMIVKALQSKEALDEITAGKITRPDFSEMYRHAFVFLIRHIGKALLETSLNPPGGATLRNCSGYSRSWMPGFRCRFRSHRRTLTLDI
jgi:hypothetical protein